MHAAGAETDEGRGKTCLNEPMVITSLQKGAVVTKSLKRRPRCAGRKRLQRIMQGLRVTAAKAHYDLLLAITSAQPTLAAAYLATASLSLEPRPSLKWWAGVSVVGSVIQHASRLPLPFMEQALR